MDSANQEQIRKFWSDYEKYLLTQNVAANALPWYRRWAQTYIDMQGDTPLSTHTADMIHARLEPLGRQNHLSDWQFVQVIDAMRKRFACIHSSLFQQINWNYLKDSTCAQGERWSVRIPVKLNTDSGRT